MADQPYYVTSLKQLAVLARAGREDIIDAVAVLGACTVPQIAEFLGKTRNSLYYHVRALRDAGLLIETEVQREGIKTTSQYDLPGRPVIARFDLTTQRSRRVIVQLGRSRFKSGETGFVRACKSEVAVVEGSHRNLWVAHWKGWITQKELEEVNRLLHRLVDVFRQSREAGGKRSPHELTFAIAPVTGKTELGI
jgi:DNA-binding transcriptional ArsR family regulator